MVVASCCLVRSILIAGSWRPAALAVKSCISAIQETYIALELGKTTLKPHQESHHPEINKDLPRILMFSSDIFFYVYWISQGNGETLVCIVQQNSFEASTWAVDDEPPLRGITRNYHNLKEHFYIMTVT